MKRVGIICFAAILLSAPLSGCGSSPRIDSPSPTSVSPVSSRTIAPAPIAQSSQAGSLSLPDTVAFSQEDPRWEYDRMGTTSDTLGHEGCLVTAASMALTNLGFQTNPQDLNKRLTATKSYTDRGWLIWDGIRRVTDGRAVATYYDKVDAPTIDACMRRGAYPMVQFYLPNGRSHWAMIVKHDARGYHMRDPLRVSKKPLIFPAGIDGYRAVRCVGLAT